MPAIQPTTSAAVNGNITITGHAADSTLIFDASQGQGTSYTWEVHIQNLDADSGDTVFIGFSAPLSLSATGFHLGIYADGNEAHRIKLRIPPHGKVWANCAAGETRDLRVIATPIF